jgi:hypothetical protein
VHFIDSLQRTIALFQGVSDSFDKPNKSKLLWLWHIGH